MLEQWNNGTMGKTKTWIKKTFFSSCSSFHFSIFSFYPTFQHSIVPVFRYFRRVVGSPNNIQLLRTSAFGLKAVASSEAILESRFAGRSSGPKGGPQAQRSSRPPGRSCLGDDELEHAFVGEKSELVEGNSFHDLLKKGQGETDRFRKIERCKAAAKKAGSPFGFPLGHQFVLSSLLQEVNVGQRSRGWAGQIHPLRARESRTSRSLSMLYAE